MDYRNNGKGREPNEAAIRAVTKGLCANELIRIILNRERTQNLRTRANGTLVCHAEDYR